MSTVSVYHGDSRELLKAMPSNSVDSVVTDPPYALVSILERYGSADARPTTADVYARATSGFMGRLWDTGETAFSVEFWSEVLRVLKPGGHVVASSGTRTYHRLACAIEDAGFEIRDQLAWLYGSGFPKSKDLARMVDEWLGVVIAKGKRHVPVTDEACELAGWGTALKPALEPVVLARKPLVGNLARNALAFGTGGLNIDACRIPVTGADVIDLHRPLNRNARPEANVRLLAQHEAQAGVARLQATGRWPANVAHDGSAEVVEAFPRADGQKGAVTGDEPSAATGNTYNPRQRIASGVPRGDEGSASRFFYSAKAGDEDRLGSDHPTVKPVDWPAWLIRLVTPPGGVVLDPFAGTGTTGLAAIREGMDCILIEREADHAEDIRRRMAWARGEGKLTRQEVLRKDLAADPGKAGGADLPLFAGGEG